jgi:hypothetical protein
MQYIGQKQVKTINEGFVTYEDDSTEQFSTSLLEHIITEEPVDASKLRELRCLPIVKIITQVLVDYGIYSSEVDFIHQLTLNNLDIYYKKALSKLFNAENEFKISLQLINNVLKQ